MSSSASSERRLVRTRIACAGTVLLTSILFTAVGAKAQDASQDVAEAARQEKARKAAQATRQSHIYTNDDLQRTQIISADGGASVEARGKKAEVVPAAGAKKSAAPSVAVNGDAGNVSAMESLGEVARRYRREKAARQAEEARENRAASPFHMGVPQPSLAAIAPRQVALAASPVLAMKNGKARPSAAPVKRDPFFRPLLARVERRMDAPTVHAANSEVAELPVAPLAVTRTVAPQLAVAPAIPATKVTPLQRPIPAIAPAPSATAAIAPNPEVSSRGGRALSIVPARSLPVARRVADGSVTILAGDSLWKLSRRYFGSGLRWREWLASNPAVVDPLRIRAGTALAVPRAEQQSRLDGNAGTEKAAQTVGVHVGDSLSKIAAERYGSGAQWRCVAAANPGLRDVDLIFPGQILMLPVACGTAGSSLSAAAH
jgi:nucleoid-associated protein YgaU